MGIASLKIFESGHLYSEGNKGFTIDKFPISRPIYRLQPQMPNLSGYPIYLAPVRPRVRNEVSWPKCNFHLDPAGSAGIFLVLIAFYLVVAGSINLNRIN